MYAWISPPPSTSTDVTPALPSRTASAWRSTRPLRWARNRQTSAPRATSAASRAAGAAGPHAKIVRGPDRPGRTWADGGVRKRLSTTIRSGLRPPWRRAVSRGSSASTVPIPTRTASWVSRSRMTSARAASPVIHFERPVTVAILPSSVIAALSVNAGRPYWAQVRNGRLARSQASRSTPTVTWIRARRSSSMPPPWSGIGSSEPITTRATPASRTAGAHGGVRPWWLHGSRLQYSVAPGALPPSVRSAAASP